jgi:hypothetical protein
MSIKTTGEREDRQWVYIDSKDRDIGSVSNENFVITLNNVAERVRRVRITDIQIPYSFYPINVNNNVLDFNDTGLTLQSVTVTPGIYTADELATELQAQMNASMPGFTITYDSKTLKFTWANAATFEILISGSISKFIGIIADSGIVTTFVGQGAIDIGGPNYLFIKSDTLVRPKVYKPYNNAAQSNIIYKVPIATGPGTVISDKNIETSFALKYGSNQQILSIDLSLEDPDGNIPDLNNINWSCTLIFETN